MSYLDSDWFIDHLSENAVALKQSALQFVPTVNL